MRQLILFCSSVNMGNFWSSDEHVLGFLFKGCCVPLTFETGETFILIY